MLKFDGKSQVPDNSLKTLCRLTLGQYTESNNMRAFNVWIDSFWKCDVLFRRGKIVHLARSNSPSQSDYDAVLIKPTESESSKSAWNITEYDRIIKLQTCAKNVSVSNFRAIGSKWLVHSDLSHFPKSSVLCCDENNIPFAVLSNEHASIPFILFLPPNYEKLFEHVSSSMFQVHRIKELQDFLDDLPSKYLKLVLDFLMAVGVKFDDMRLKALNSRFNESKKSRIFSFNEIVSFCDNVSVVSMNVFSNSVIGRQWSQTTQKEFFLNKNSTPISRMGDFVSYSKSTHEKRLRDPYEESMGQRTSKKTKFSESSIIVDETDVVSQTKFPAAGIASQSQTIVESAEKMYERRKVENEIVSSFIALMRTPRRNNNKGLYRLICILFEVDIMDVLQKLKTLSVDRADDVKARISKICTEFHVKLDVLAR